MNKKQLLFGIVVLMAASLVAIAQDTQTDRVTVPLTNPGKPGTVKVDVLMGSIKVVGYEGKEVIVEAKPREKMIGEDRDEEGLAAHITAAIAGSTGRKDKDKEKSAKDKTAGMKRIPIENTGLTVEEDNNNVSIEVESYRRTVDLSIKVPYATSLKLSGTNLDDIGIIVENVSGEIEIEGTNGGIVLKNVSGTVVANTTNGDIEATLAQVTPNKPMSFVTFNGDVDVTLPAETKATLSLKSSMGDVYSDFDIVLKQMPVKSEESGRSDRGKFRVSLDRAFSGAINGGGPEFKLQNFNGNIYIRKKK